MITREIQFYCVVTRKVFAKKGDCNRLCCIDNTHISHRRLSERPRHEMVCFQQDDADDGRSTEEPFEKLFHRFLNDGHHHRNSHLNIFQTDTSSNYLIRIGYLT